MLGQIIIQMGYVAPYFWLSFSFVILMTLPIAIIGLSRAKSFNVVMNLGISRVFFLFLIYYFVFLIYKYVDGVELDFLTYHLKSVLRLIAFYFITINFYLGGTFNERRNSFIVVFIGLLVVYLSAGGFVNISAIEFEDGYFELDYQMLAFLILFFVINNVALNYHKNNIIVSLLMVLSLYYLGARTEFYIALMLFIFAEFLKTNNKSGVIALFALFLMIFMPLLYFYIDGDGLSNIRIFAVLFDEDASQESRANLTMNAMETISRNPFFGDFASHELGAYSHNLLSAWVDFGIIGFIYLGLIVFAPFFHALTKIHKTTAPVYILTISSLVALVFAFMLAKTYNYTMLAVALAYYGLWISKRGNLKND